MLSLGSPGRQISAEDPQTLFVIAAYIANTAYISRTFYQIMIACYFRAYFRDLL